MNDFQLLSRHQHDYQLLSYKEVIFDRYFLNENHFQFLRTCFINCYKYRDNYKQNRLNLNHSEINNPN